jgi:pyrophosphatase PpaX
MRTDYDAYLFDWDGTLGRSLEMWLDVVRLLLEKYGVENVPDDVVIASFGNMKKMIPEAGLPAEKIKDFMADALHESHLRSMNIELYDGAIDTLERLKNEGKKLALITTNWRKSVELMLKNHSMQHIFDHCITGDDVKEHKPDPEGILRALTEIGIEKDRSVMIGDTENDLGAAANAGIDSILFYPPSHQLFYDLTKLQEHKPTRVIAGWEEL